MPSSSSSSSLSSAASDDVADVGALDDVVDVDDEVGAEEGPGRDAGQGGEGGWVVRRGRRGAGSDDDGDDDDDDGDGDGGGGFRWVAARLNDAREDIRARPLPTPAEVRGMADELYAEWVDPDVGVEALTPWTLERYGLDVDRVAEVTTDEVEHGIQRRKYQFKTLVGFCHELNLFYDDGELKDRMRAIERVMDASYQACLHTFLLFTRLEETRPAVFPPTVEGDGHETLTDHDASKLTSFQSLLLHLLKLIEVKRYRKCGESCYQQVYTPLGHATQAYAFACSIKDMVYSVRKEVDFAMWKIFTMPRDNPRAVHEHLIESKQEEFPEVDVGDGYYFAFEDGIYDIRRDLFFVFGDDWEAYASAMWAARRDAGRGVALPEEDEARGTYAWPTRDSACVNYFEQPFRFRIRPQDVAAGGGEGGGDDDDDPMRIPTPTFDQLLNTQRFDDEMKRDLYMMIGRTLFLTNTLDRWQRALMLIGTGGTGKSCIANWLMHVIPPQFYAIINSNFEEQFGLGGICKKEKRLCVCTELTEDLRFKQEEFQICCEGGELQVAKKGVDSFPFQFRMPLIFCGNQYPRKWKNNGRQISRRTFLAVFRYTVPKEQVDTEFSKRICGETDVLLRKCTQVYVRKTQANPGKDLEAPGMMSAQARSFLTYMEAAIDPLTAFLESDAVERKGDGFILFDDFKRLYSDYRRSNGFPLVPLTRDHFMTVFQSYNIFNRGIVQVDDYNGSGLPKKGEMLQGITFRAPQEDEGGGAGAGGGGGGY